MKILKTTRIILINLLIITGTLAIAAEASANCRWSTNSQCSDIGSSWSPANDESYCSGDKPNGATVKCCCGDDDAIIFTPQIKLPDGVFSADKIPVGELKNGVMSSDLFAKYIQAFYNYGMKIVGILAAVVLMAGGLLWLTSAGNDSRITQAKELIGGSIIGSLVLLSSWVILNTINPELLNLQVIKTEVAKQVNFGCCMKDGKPSITADFNCEKNQFFPDKIPNLDKNICDTVGCCTVDQRAGFVGIYDYCVQATQSNCPSKIPGGTYHAAKCGSLTDCAKVTSNCVGIANGKPCQNGPFESFCYSNVCYPGTGSLGEPCGSDPGAKCDKDEPQSNRKCNGSGGGRSCTGPLWCCQFKANGDRLNK